MRQVRRISNLIAEELQEALDAKGITLDESTFEGRVSEIVEYISESVNEKSSVVDEDVILEDVSVAEVYMATKSATLAGTEVLEGDFVGIDEIDLDENKATVTIYDSEGEVKEEELDVDIDEINTFSESAEAVDVDDEEVEEGVHIKGGKKVKVSAAVEKLRKKLKDKKGNGVNKFTIKAGKLVRKTAAQLKASKEKAKTFARDMKKYVKKRAKSLKKSLKLNSGSTSGTVSEGFDITSDGMKFACEAGDIIKCEEGMISIVREGAELIAGIKVADNFIDRCVSEGVLTILESEDSNDEDENVEEGKGCKNGRDKSVDENDDNEDGEANEGAILTFRSNQGFVLIKEGSEIPMGNRIRTRSFLRSSGYEVTSEHMDRASAGETVIL